MVHIIKVCLENSKNEKEIRRLAVSSDVASSFILLREKIQSLFQLAKNSFEMKWKDSDNDFIVMSSDGELAQALANSEEDLLRVYLFLKDNVQTEPKTSEVPKDSDNDFIVMSSDEGDEKIARALSKSEEDLLREYLFPNANVQTEPKTSEVPEAHPNVVCDGCVKIVFGDRYKCLQCKNFDLCSVCNSANKHPDHDMIKLVKPAHIPREWVFLGARKIWRSMFGYCPSGYFSHCQEKKCPSSKKSEGSQNQKPESSQRQSNDFSALPDVFNTFLNGDFVEAQKLFTEGLGNFMNVLPGGLEIKLEKCPFSAECKVKPQDDVKKPQEDAKKPQEDVKKPQEDVKKPQEKESECATPPDTKQDTKVANVEEKSEVLAEPKKIGTAETLQANKPNDDEVKVVSKESANIEAKSEVQSDAGKEKSPTNDVETSTGPDGWTFLHEDETTRQEPSATGTSVEKPANDVKYPKLEDILSKSDQGNVIQTNDPKIINALIKMQAMGFTNEGGWLERLLITKQGNINEALDALYPHAPRH